MINFTKKKSGKKAGQPILNLTFKGWWEVIPAGLFIGLYTINFILWLMSIGLKALLLFLKFIV